MATGKTGNLYLQKEDTLVLVNDDSHFTIETYACVRWI